MIELLVVITIIVVLLALLVPAMDQAIYQAELAVCGSQMRTTTRNLMDYAGNNKRYYPSRKLRNATTALSSLTTDDRKTVGQAMDLDILVDPLCQTVDLKTPGTVEDNYASYSLWFGWSYTGHRGMNKVGDRLEAPTADGQVAQFPWLLTDTNVVNTGRNSFSSHPDSQGRMHNVVDQDRLVNGSNLTSSYWFMVGSVRSEVDNNAASDDGAVLRFDRISHDPPAAQDARFVKIPNKGNATGLPLDYVLQPR